MRADVSKRWTEEMEIPPDLAVSARGALPIRQLVEAQMGVAFQPIVELGTRRLFAAEMLARCRMEALSSPAVLFERAETENATGRLGRLVRDVGFAIAPPVPLFLNLHPHELSERWIVRPDDPMNYHEHPLYLEITESAALDYFDLCRSALRELCSRTNAKLVVDDFGAGHSNLIRIAELEPAIVKLDRSLVMDVEQSPAKQKIIKHLVTLCEDLGAKVVAEGIETREELSVALDAGVHYGQGFLLARPGNPMPPHRWPL